MKSSKNVAIAIGLVLVALVGIKTILTLRSTEESGNWIAISADANLASESHQQHRPVAQSQPSLEADVAQGQITSTSPAKRDARVPSSNHVPKNRQVELEKSSRQNVDSLREDANPSIIDDPAPVRDDEDDHDSDNDELDRFEFLEEIGAMPGPRGRQGGPSQKDLCESKGIIARVDDLTDQQNRDSLPSESTVHRVARAATLPVIPPMSSEAPTIPAATHPERAAGGALPDAITERVKKHLAYGRSLASRGSTYSARNEFMQALASIAQVWDYQAGNHEFSDSFQRGILALQESQDFLTGDDNAVSGIDVRRIVLGHSSKIISKDEASRMSAAQAMQHYLRFSADEISRASGQSQLAAEVIYQLGKMHLAVYEDQPQRSATDRYQAVVLFRAAYAVDPMNTKAANELAVQLARSGELQVAKNLLVESLRQSPSPTAWQNLASIHERLGAKAAATNDFRNANQHGRLAQLAQSEVENMRYRGPLTPGEMPTYHGPMSSDPMIAGNVRWIDPASFNNMPGADPGLADGPTNPLRPGETLSTDDRPVPLNGPIGQPTAREANSGQGFLGRLKNVF